MTRQIDVAVSSLLDKMPLARLAHFTPAQNLPGILCDGELRSVKDLSTDVRACYRATDLQRLDGYPDKICCSLQYPNGFYFDIARRKHDAINYPDWVCLLIDKMVAATEGTLFCPRNAAASEAGAAAGAVALQNCYAPAVVGQGGRTRGRGPKHDPGSPTDVQAEVLVSAPIPLSAIYAIVFPTAAAAAEEYGRLDRFGIAPPVSLQWVVSPDMFDKVRIAAAVQYSDYFLESTWRPPASPTAEPAGTS